MFSGVKEKSMKYQILTLFFLAIFLLGSAESHADEQILTGDTRLACEAILCLSTGSPPSQCNPSLDRYFSIEIWECDDDCWIDWSATLAARLDFLNQCPAVDEKASSAQMHSLTNAIVHGARQCTAEILNNQNKKYKECGDEAVHRLISASRLSR